MVDRAHACRLRARNNIHGKRHHTQVAACLGRPCETTTHADSGRADVASSQSHRCRCARSPKSVAARRSRQAKQRFAHGNGEAKAGRWRPLDVQDQVCMGPPPTGKAGTKQQYLGPPIAIIPRDKWPPRTRRRVLESPHVCTCLRGGRHSALEDCLTYALCEGGWPARLNNCECCDRGR